MKVKWSESFRLLSVYNVPINYIYTSIIDVFMFKLMCCN